MVGKVMKVGIMPREDYRKRTIAIARGQFKPRRGEPKIWFESINSMAQILSSENQRLLKLIIEHKPHSLGELEQLSGRKKSNLSRTLRTMERYGIVALPKKEGKLVPKVQAADFRVEFGLNLNKAQRDQVAG